MEKIYIVCRKVNLLRDSVLEAALDDYVLKLGDKDKMSEYFRDFSRKS